MHEIHDALVGEGYQLVAFRDLPHPYRMAIAHYMAVNGVAWDLGEEDPDDDDASSGPTAERSRIMRCLELAMPRFLDQHGDLLFGVATVPMDAAKAHVMRGGDLATDWAGDFGAYHAWYVGNVDVPTYPMEGRWPSIMSGFADEAFEDGWHRFHAYCRAGHADLPVVFYPEARHFEARGLPVPSPRLDDDAPIPGMH